MAPQTEPRTPAKRRRNDTRDRILEVARDILLEDGVDALSIRRVADEVHFTPGALYRYFDSRDAIIAAVATGVFESLGEQLEAAFDEADEPLSALCAMVDVYRAFASDDPHGFALVTAMVADRRLLVADPALVGGMALTVVATLAPVARAIEEAARCGQLDAASMEQSTARAFGLFSAVQGALQLRKLALRAPDVLNADHTTVEVAGALLRGWGAPADALSFRT